MYAFPINIVDSSIDNKICKKAKAESNEYKCNTDTGTTTKKLSEVFPASANNDKIGAAESTPMSKEISGLTREEKGTLASVFAKVIEGAEVLETKGVSATSVMVNACYDLVSESIGVVPMLSGLQNKYG